MFSDNITTFKACKYFIWFHSTFIKCQVSGRRYGASRDFSVLSFSDVITENFPKRRKNHALRQGHYLQGVKVPWLIRITHCLTSSGQVDSMTRQEIFRSLLFAVSQWKILRKRIFFFFWCFTKVEAWKTFDCFCSNFA